VAKLTKKMDIIGTIEHEHAHFTYAPGHITYGKVSFGVGFDGYLSPYEMIANEYMTPTSVTSDGTYFLDDYVSHNEGDGEILKIPVQGEECFLLANRKRDRFMIE